MDAGMYAARQRHQKHCSFIVAQKEARLARWLERRARTAEPSAGLMAVRSQSHTKHHTYERRPRARRQRARRRGAGAGSRRARSLLRRSSQVLLCRGRCIECLLIKIGNNSGMANHAGIPNLVSEVSCALCSAGKSVARSCEHTSFQQYGHISMYRVLFFIKTCAHRYETKGWHTGIVLRCSGTR